MPQTKSIAVKCTNVAAQAYLTMRLEASAVSGQAMVSDNQDLGFIVADQNDTPITPNDLNSVIPFRLDAAAAANVTLRARPISITGQKPTEGPFSALGYLRVDYHEVRRMRRALFSCFCGLLWIPVDGQLTLWERLISICTVTLLILLYRNTADIDKTVDLGRWPTTQLLNAGDTTALVPFSLRLEGCPPGSVAILFTGTPASDTNLLALDDPAMAQTIAIELRNSDRSRLALGAASPTEEVDANGNVTLNFFANYRALASGVRPGVAKADAIFMINYN
ncbi:fimbrial protein [Escherichia coli]|uniref:Fimbrial protein n=8 Tax=Escherichia TaxID=561 RepID=A0A376RPC7_ECOLX|nr:fimbrial protein [Escherichia coli]